MHRELGQGSLWRVARQSKLPQPKEITQGQEGSHVARWWQAEPTAVLTTGPCCGPRHWTLPIFPPRFFRYFPYSWSQLICQTQGLSLSLASLNKEPVFQCLAQQEV